MVKTAGRVIMYVFLIVALILYLFPFIDCYHSFKPLKICLSHVWLFQKSLFGQLYHSL